MFIALSQKHIALRRSEMLSERHGAPTEREFERTEAINMSSLAGRSQRRLYTEASDLELWQCATCHRFDTKLVHKVID